jgi:hypothetical protein
VNVTTGGITVAAGTLIVGTLGIAALMTVRDENQGPGGCRPQSFEVATDDVAELDDAAVVPSDQVRDQVDEDYPLPEWDRDGYVIVALDRAKKGVTPPACLDSTPVVYVKARHVAG